MLKRGWGCYYCHPNLQTKARNPFTLLTTHANRSLGKLSGHTLLPSAHVTTQVWHHTPLSSLPSSSPYVYPLPPLPYMLLTAARGNERDTTQNKTQTLPGSPPCPPFDLSVPHSSHTGYSADSWHTKVTPASAPLHSLFLVPGRLFPQIFHRAGTFVPFQSQLTCHNPSETLPQHPLSSFPQPLQLPDVSLSPFCFDDSTALFIPTWNFLTNLFTTILDHLCTSTWTLTPGERAFSGSDPALGTHVTLNADAKWTSQWLNELTNSILFHISPTATTSKCVLISRRKESPQGSYNTIRNWSQDIPMMSSMLVL